MTVIGASLLMGLAVWIAMPSATRKQEGRHLPAWSGIPVGFLVAFWRERCGVGRYDSSRGRNGARRCAPSASESPDS